MQSRRCISADVYKAGITCEQNRFGRRVYVYKTQFVDKLAMLSYVIHRAGYKVFSFRDKPVDKLFFQCTDNQ